MRLVLSDMWHFYRARWLDVLRHAAAFYLALVLLSLLAVAELGVWAIAPVAYVWLVSSFWLQVPLARLVAGFAAGEVRVSVRSTFAQLSPRLGRVTAASALAALGIYLGFLLFVVPGLVLMTRWALLMPVLALEDTRLFGAFARSRDLVRGQGGKVFGGIVLSALTLGALAIFVLVLAESAASSFGQGLVPLLAGAAALTAVLSVTVPLIALGWTFAYLRLRGRRPAQASLPGRLPVSGTLDSAWLLYARHPGRAIALALIVFAPIAAVGGLLGLGDFVPITIATEIAGYLVLQGLLAAGRSTLDEPSARRWLAALFRSTRRRLPVLAGVAVLAGLAFATVVGLVLLVIWGAAGAVAVLEDRGPMASLRRSARLTKGRRRRILKLLALSLLVASSGAIAVASFLPSLPAGAGAYVLALGVNAVTAPYVGYAWALMYAELLDLELAQSETSPDSVAGRPAGLSPQRV